MNQTFHHWVEGYLFNGRRFSWRLLAYLLLPLTLLYCLVITLKRLKSRALKPPIPVISIGNLTVGGSGKTPLTIALCKNYPKAAVVMRGYGRKSEGVQVVCNGASMICGVEASGDEAQLIAKKSGNIVVVAEDRLAGIQRAKELGAEWVILDDGFSKYHIQKYDVLIRPTPEPTNAFCLPSGCYREPYRAYQRADCVVREGEEFHPHVTIENPTNKMVLVTAIAKPERLEPYLPECVGKVYFRDHHFFTPKELKAILHSYGADSILCTEKDAVKIESYNLPISLMRLELVVGDTLLDRINSYLNQH